MDSGFREARRFVLQFMIPAIERVLEGKHEKDYKTLLQEYSQRVFRMYPKYILTKKTGPDHERVFWIEVEVNNRRYGPGHGLNKKQAEQAAAGIAFESLARGDARRSRSRKKSGRSQ